MTQNTNFTQLVTHAGKFHADEVLGRALTIVLGFPGEFIRTNQPTQRQLLDPKVLVWDIGQQYNALLNNYDHHQDGALPAACMLLLRHFYPAGPVRDILENRLFRYVSHVDTGEIIEDTGEEHTVPTFNSIIRNLNSLGSFDTAVEFAVATLRSTIAMAESAVHEETIWKKEVKIRNRVAFYDGGAHFITWRDLGKKYGADLFVSPDKRSGDGWRLEAATLASSAYRKAWGSAGHMPAGFSPCSIGITTRRSPRLRYQKNCRQFDGTGFLVHQTVKIL